jgi:hypothetical protein
MNNDFLPQFSQNIKFSYSCYDRVIIRGYNRSLFTCGGLVHLLKAMGLRIFSPDVLRTFTNRLNNHIAYAAARHRIPVIWWPSVCKKKKGKKSPKNDGNNGDKLKYVQKHFVRRYKEKGISPTASSPIWKPWELLFPKSISTVKENRNIGSIRGES